MHNVDDDNPFVTVLKYDDSTGKFTKKYGANLRGRIPYEVFEEIVETASRAYSSKSNKFTIYHMLVYAAILVLILIGIAISVVTCFFCGPLAWVVFGDVNSPEYKTKKYPTKMWPFYLITPLYFFGLVMLCVFGLSNVFNRIRHRTHINAIVYTRKKLKELILTKHRSLFSEMGIGCEIEHTISPGMTQYDENFHGKGVMYWWFPNQNSTVNVVSIEKTLEGNSLRSEPLVSYQPVLKIVDLQGIENTLQARAPDYRAKQFNSLMHLFRNSTSNKKAIASVAYSYTLKTFVESSDIAQVADTLLISVEKPDSAVNKVNSYLASAAVDDPSVSSYFFKTLKSCDDAISNTLKYIVWLRVAFIGVVVASVIPYIIALVLLGVYILGQKRRRDYWAFYCMLPVTILQTVLVFFVSFMLADYLFRKYLQSSISRISEIIFNDNKNVYFKCGLECSVTTVAYNKPLTLPLLSNFGIHSFNAPSTPVIHVRQIQ